MIELRLSRERFYDGIDALRATKGCERLVRAVVPGLDYLDDAESVIFLTAEAIAEAYKEYAVGRPVRIDASALHKIRLLPVKNFLTRTIQNELGRVDTRRGILSNYVGTVNTKKGIIGAIDLTTGAKTLARF